MTIGVSDEEGFKTREGSQQSQRSRDTDLEQVIKQVNNRSKNIVKYLSEGLGKKVYQKKDIDLINQMREVLDIKALWTKVANFGPLSTSELKFPTWMSAARNLVFDTISGVGETVLRNQFTNLCRKLFELRDEGEAEMDSLSIITRFFHPSLGLYR